MRRPASGSSDWIRVNDDGVPIIPVVYYPPQGKVMFSEASVCSQSGV